MQVVRLVGLRALAASLVAFSGLAGVLPGQAQDNGSFILQQIKAVKWGQYMATNCQPIDLAGWIGMSTETCTYASYSGYGDIKVIMLNAGPERMSKWLLSACTDAGAKYPVHCTERLALRIQCQSGNQFPVAGLVDEGSLYVFRDGVTVKLKEFAATTLNRKPTEVEQTLALGTGTVESVKQYARVQGTTRAEYAASMGQNVNNYAGLAWQTEIKAAYQRAWTSDKNDLLTAWAKANIGQIDHKLEPAAKFDDYCKDVAKAWSQWSITGE